MGTCVESISVLFEQTTVGEFLQQTLTCQAETPIQDILDLLQHQSGSAAASAEQAGSIVNQADLSQLVVVNAQQQPIYSIPLSQFIGLFIAEQQLAPALSPQQPIAEWANLEHQPLQCVPGTYSLKQFWQYLQTFSQDVNLSWAIVQDTTQKYLGLLDTPKLVQFLAHQTPLSVAIKFSSDLKSSVSSTLELADPPPLATDSAISPKTAPSDSSLSAELLAEISHELKSPLTAVLSLSNVLSHQGIQHLSERQIQYVQLIHQKSQQLMGIVNNLLDLTQLQTPAQPEPRNTVNLDLLCADAIAQAKRYYLLEQGTLETASLTIQRDSTEPLGILSTHELKLRQILVHLLHNALGLTNGLSTIELRVERWQGWVIFTIQDQGVCVPAPQQPFIFQLPQTWTNPDSEHLGKTGLGLILAQRFAEQIFGDITFRSGPDQGNTFSLYVPTEPTRSNRADYTKGLILIIATEPALIASLNQHLANRSLQTVIARADQEALQKIKTFNPQAVLLQTTLTTSSGWDVLAMLRQLACTRPILLISNEADNQRALDAGANGCLTLTSLNPGLDQWLDEWLGNSLPSQADRTNPIGPNQAISSRSDSPNLQKLTVLHLDGNLEPLDSSLPIDINPSLYGYQWRVISTTTLEEAEWLANIWKPNVVLYTADDPAPLLGMASDSPLTQYPFVILHPDAQHIARQRSDLKVFTDANFTTLSSNAELSEVSSLLQVLNNITIASE